VEGRGELNDCGWWGFQTFCYFEWYVIDLVLELTPLLSLLSPNCDLCGFISGESGGECSSARSSSLSLCRVGGCAGAAEEDGFLPPKRIPDRFMIGISITSATSAAATSVKANSVKNSVKRFSTL